MIRSRRLSLAGVVLSAGLLFVATGCDTSSSDLLTPIEESETSFEDGLGAFLVRSGPSGTGTAELATGSASDGSSYVSVTLENPGDLIWIEQVYTLTPGTRYNVTVSADARTFSGSGELVYAAMGRSLQPGDFQSQGPVPGAWTRELMPTPVTAGPDGRVAVGVGVGASVTGAGVFGLDRVGVVFTIRPEN
jgi:hypothetical protein